jgi:hypothetical protein
VTKDTFIKRIEAFRDALHELCVAKDTSPHLGLQKRVAEEKRRLTASYAEVRRAERHRIRALVEGKRLLGCVAGCSCDDCELIDDILHTILTHD